MRELATAAGIRRFMRTLGRVTHSGGACYLTGGATAVLLGWRETTIDIDVAFVPEQDAVLQALPRIKEELRLNVELASPGDFIPLPSGWQERSLSIGREGDLSFMHFDPYSQALAKLERAHVRDLDDVRALAAMSLVQPRLLRTLFDEIEPRLYRFPAIAPHAFRARVEEAFPASPE